MLCQGIGASFLEFSPCMLRASGARKKERQDLKPLALNPPKPERAQGLGFRVLGFRV